MQTTVIPLITLPECLYAYSSIWERIAIQREKEWEREDLGVMKSRVLQQMLLKILNYVPIFV